VRNESEQMSISVYLFDSLIDQCYSNERDIISRIETMPNGRNSVSDDFSHHRLRLMSLEFFLRTDSEVNVVLKP